MRTLCRKSAPRVKAGRVQKKNNWTLSPDYYRTPFRMPLIDRKRPGEGYRHLISKRDVETFIALLPDWNELSQGLNAIVLAPGGEDADGSHAPGVVHVCAWERELWRWPADNYFQEHRGLFERLGVPCEYDPRERCTVCKFTESTASAYQLLHILIHELGHHHDRMTSRSRRNAGRGESYAEEYALRYADLIWDRYCEAFGMP
jgi:hypothetical protein